MGSREIPIDRDHYSIGRRTTSDIRLTAPDVSKEHAEILRMGESFVLRDRGSRFGTFLNGQRIQEQRLQHGDRIELGKSGGVLLTFVTSEHGVELSGHSTVIDNLGQVGYLLHAIRAIGSARLVDEVLALVLDLAIDLTRAERGYILLATPRGVLEMKAARGADHRPLPTRDVVIGRKTPARVFATGREEMIEDLQTFEVDGHAETLAAGIRSMLCVPLQLVQHVNEVDAPPDPQTIGVLYLDGQQRARFLTPSTRTALDALAREAAGAIEHARLYHEALDKAQVDQELRLAAEIQQALLPAPRRIAGFIDVYGMSLPCRAVGGDFFDYLDLPRGAVGIALGDVAGKGPPAALLTAVLQGMLSALATVGLGASAIAARINEAMLVRSVDGKYATAFFGVLETNGQFTYCNAGQNTPYVFSASGIRRLETGGRPLGILPGSTYEEDRVQLSAGDTLVLFSDGVPEASAPDGEAFGDDRILEVVLAHLSETPEQITGAVMAAVRAFCHDACQRDDITLVVLRYGG